MSERLGSIINGTDEDLKLVRDVKQLIRATSDRETVRRMAIFCKVLLDHQGDDGEIVLCKQGRPDRVVFCL